MIQGTSIPACQLKGVSQICRSTCSGGNDHSKPLQGELKATTTITHSHNVEQVALSQRGRMRSCRLRTRPRLLPLHLAAGASKLSRYLFRSTAHNRPQSSADANANAAVPMSDSQHQCNPPRLSPCQSHIADAACQGCLHAKVKSLLQPAKVVSMPKTKSLTQPAKAVSMPKSNP